MYLIFFFSREENINFVSLQFVVPRGFCVTSYALEWQLQNNKQLQDMIADIVDISCGKKEEDLKSCCEK